MRGYEIHHGISHGPALARPALQLGHGPDGAVSEDGQILGTYLHGLFDTPAACQALIRWAGLSQTDAVDGRQLAETAIDRLADAVADHLDTDALATLLGG